VVASPLDQPPSTVFTDSRIDCIISCIASRSGAPGDSWAVDHKANVNLLDAALASPTPPKQFVMLSAYCVRKPELVVSTGTTSSTTYYYYYYLLMLLLLLCD